MEEIRFYSEEEAQKKLDEDLDKICNILEPYYEPYAYLGEDLIRDEMTSFFDQNDYDDIVSLLPEGWDINMSDFSIVFGDNQKNGETIYVPTIIPNIGSSALIADLVSKIVKK